MSHPSTAVHNATNATGADPSKQSNEKPPPTTVPSGGSVPGAVSTLPSNATQGFQLFERTTFKDSIMIHVIDDSKKEKRDFTFSRSLLVKYMKYFDRCLKKISDNDEIDISIHCDAQIFEWLLNYIFAMEEYEKKQAENERLQKSNW
jgi:hypothetical protein